MSISHRYSLYGSRPAGRIFWVVGCREKLDWLPLYSLREGMERTTNWYLDGFGRRDAATIERLLMEQN